MRGIFLFVLFLSTFSINGQELEFSPPKDNLCLIVSSDIKESHISQRVHDPFLQWVTEVHAPLCSSFRFQIIYQKKFDIGLDLYTGLAIHMERSSYEYSGQTGINFKQVDRSLGFSTPIIFHYPVYTIREFTVGILGGISMHMVNEPSSTVYKFFDLLPDDRLALELTNKTNYDTNLRIEPELGIQAAYDWGKNGIFLRLSRIENERLLARGTMEIQQGEFYERFAYEQDGISWSVSFGTRLGL